MLQVEGSQIMPRIHLLVQDIDELEDLEDTEQWEELIGLRDGDERLRAQQGSAEMRDRRRSARGSVDAAQQRRSERRKTIRRGGKRD
jgi:hypothetical protein